ncbi:MAG: hypothetical protein DI533_04595 [Cereibacter sphaeroides]|uniref:Uncharacterized protein n=1 Tax=Cereibacter sphaeroides TaxID=1063 RepID=A0A2W5SKS4_CERSP|nr:MAG: hypothetical protein DI533_04595 [Cereibacter sphaeroides]
MAEILKEPRRPHAEVAVALAGMPGQLRMAAAATNDMVFYLDAPLALMLARRIEAGERVRVLEIPVRRPDTRVELFFRAFLLGVGGLSFVDLTTKVLIGLGVLQ